MFCSKCGEENSAQAQLCHRCGAPLWKSVHINSVPGILLEKRILGFFALVGALLVQVGLFVPWVSANELGISLSASAWDSVTTAEVLIGEKAERESWAILALVGTVITLVSSLAAFAFPKAKLLWCLVGIGGILAVAGALWAFSDIDSGSVWGISVSHGIGLYLTFVGGILCFISGFLGLLFGLFRKSLLD